MGRGNDAIPTWSGFNYQGKMMLLYVLELINQIVKDKNKDIDAYSVELEKTEDFCIICDSEYKSFHQVKAYLSISAISLADLLTQQGIGQIVLSTHEEAKAALLRYKFKHAGMSVREQNMQALYMKTVTEE